MNARPPALPPQPLTRAKARNCALINQLATPGLGSLLARRWVAGIGQLVLAVVGFVMIIGWFGLQMVGLYQQFSNGAQPRSVAWLGQAGALVFAAAWLWALITSLSLMRQAR